jgi:tetratricopeptide (TPR) repeat protein
MKTRLWRLAALSSLTLLICLAALGAVIWRYRDTLAYLVMAPSPAGRPFKKPLPPKPSPAITVPPIHVKVEQKRVFSWAGLKMESYSGRLAGDFQAVQSMGDLEQSLMDAIKDLQEDSGIFPTAGDKIRFLPKDSRDCTFSEPYAVMAGSKGELRVEFPVEPLVLHWWPVREMLASALGEAILKEELPAFSDAPEWFRAGLMLNLSTFGRDYARRTILESDSPPLRLINPLAGGSSKAWVDGYWAFRAMIARQGPDSLKQVVAALRAGQSWQKALEGVTGQPLEAFTEGYRKWTEAHLRDITANRKTLLDAVTLLRERKEDQALPILHHFVQNHPLDLYAGNAEYFLNYARYRLGRYDEAINGFTGLLLNHPYTTSWQGKGHYFLGRCYQLSGYGPLALPEYRLASVSPNDQLLVKLARMRIKELQ